MKKQQPDEWEGIPDEYRNIESDSIRFRVAWWLQRLVLFPLLGFYTRYLNRTEFIGLKNLEGLQNQTFLVCPNHTSSWDIWSAFEVGFQAQSGYFARSHYMCGLGAIERLGNRFSRWFATASGVLAVNRRKGLDQWALQDVDRLLRERKSQIACLIYPEGTRSRNGRLSKDYKAGAGWLQAVHQIPVVPVYQVNYNRLPGLGQRLRIVIGKPMEFPEYQSTADSPSTWIAITGKIMQALHQLEEEYNPMSAEDQAEMKAVRDSLARDMRLRFPDEARAFCRELNLRLPVLGVLPPGRNPHTRLSHNLGSQGMLGFVSTAFMAREKISHIVDEMSQCRFPWGVEWFHNPWQNQAQRLVRMEEIAGKTPAILVRSCPAPETEIVLARLKGITSQQASQVMIRVSLPHTAALFAAPPPEAMVRTLLEAGRITEDEAQRAANIPLATHIVVDGTAESRDLMTLFPAVRKVCRAQKVKTGVIGGFGTPEGLEAAMAMGASFVVYENVLQATNVSELGACARGVVNRMRLSDVQKAWIPEGYEFQLREDTVRCSNLYAKDVERLNQLLRSAISVQTLSAAAKTEISRKFFDGQTLDTVFANALKELRSYFPELCDASESEDGLRRLNLLGMYWMWLRMLDTEADEPDQKIHLLIRGDAALAAFLEWKSSTPVLQSLGSDAATLLERLCRDAGISPMEVQQPNVLESLGESLVQS